MKKYFVEIEKSRGWVTHSTWPTREEAEADAKALRPTVTKTVRVRSEDQVFSKGDRVVVCFRHSDRQITTVGRETETRCMAGFQFSRKTGRQVGGSRVIVHATPELIAEIEAEQNAKQEADERENEQRDAERKAREATPEYQLAKKICDSDDGWDWPQTWVDRLGMDLLRQIADKIGVKE